MRVVVESIVPEPEKGRVRLTVRIGDEQASQFLAELHDSNFCTIEHELFMRLSELAGKRYCNCVIYQSELMEIIKAFVANESRPPLPLELGTTEYGMPRPTAARIFIDRLRRPFLRAWLRRKFRHIRRENLVKDAKGAK